MNPKAGVCANMRKAQARHFMVSQKSLAFLISQKNSLNNQTQPSLFLEYIKLQKGRRPCGEVRSYGEVGGPTAWMDSRSEKPPLSLIKIQSLTMKTCTAGTAIIELDFCIGSFMFAQECLFFNTVLSQTLKRYGPKN